MKKQTILIDIDDVLVYSFELPFLNKFLGTSYVEDDFNDYILEKISAEKMQEFCDFLLTQDIYGDQTLHIKKDAREVLERLNEKYEVYLCSDYTFWERPWESDKFFVEKFEMLKRHFSFINPSQHIFCRNKKLLCADVIIDDRIENYGEGVKRRILYTTYHNKKADETLLKSKNIERVNSWEEIAQLLLK